MPVIPKYELQRIDTRVQEANLNTEGVGVVAKAIGAIGASGAQFANELLQRRKVAEANAYSSESYRLKAIESERKKNELFNDMDPLTGRVKSTGRSLFEEMQEWELSRSEELEAEAPTDLARDTFKNMESRAITSRLADIDTLQYKSMYQANIELDDKRAMEDSKKYPGHDNNSGTTVYQLANADISLSEREIIQKIGTIYSDAEARERLNKYNNTRALTATESMLQQKAYYDFAKSNGLLRMVPAQMEQMKKAFEGEGLIPKGGEVVFNNKGEPILIGDKVGDKVKIKNLLTQQEELADIEYPKRQVMEMEAINVGADAQENLIYKYLNEKNIVDNMWKLARSIKEDQANIKKELVDEARNWSTSLSTTSPNRLRLSNEDTNKNFQDLVGRINNVSSEVMDDVDKRNLIGELTSSAVVGEFKDRMKFNNVADSARAMNAIPDLVKARVASLGQQERYGTPEFMSTVSERAMAETASTLEDISKKINTNMPNYLQENDSRFAVLDSKKFNSPRDFKNYVDHVDKRLNQMGVPPHNAKYFTPDSLALDANQLSRSMEGGANDGYRGALNWLIQKKASMGDKYPQYVEELSRYGISEDMKFVALFPDNTRGNATAQRAIENMVSTPDRVKLLPEKVRSDLFLKVQEKIAPHLEGIRRKYPESTREKNVMSFIKMTLGETYRAYIANGGDSDSAVKTAVESMVNQNFTTVHRGNSVITLSLMEQQMYGLNDDVVKKADKYFTSKDFIVSNIDLEKSFPQMTKLLDTQGFKGRSKAERNAKAYEFLNSGISNLNGAFNLGVDKDRAYPSFILKDTGDIMGLYGNDGKLFSKPLKDMSKDQNILKQNLNVFGELFKMESDIYEGKEK